MSRVRINANGQNLSLPTNIEGSFYISKQGHDIRDLTTRTASFSKAITLPMNENNINILGDWLPFLASHNSNPYKYIPCTVYMDEVPVISDALLYVTETNYLTKEISANILGGGKTYFNQLSENPISDLDFTTENFDWDMTTLETLVDTTTGVCFPNAIYHSNSSYEKFAPMAVGNDAVVDDLDIRRAGFWFYLRTIWNKIHENINGIEFDFDTLDDTDFNKMALFCPVTMFAEGRGVIGWFAGGTYTNSIQEEQTRILNLTTYKDTAAIWDATDKNFVIPLQEIVNISVDISTTTQPNNTDTSIEPDPANILFLDYWNGSTWLTARADNINASYYVVSSGRITYNTSLSLPVGGKVRLRIISSKLVSYPDTITQKINWVLHDFSVSFGTTIDYIKVNEYLPQISQRDFVKDVLQRFHLIPNQEDGVVTFKMWKEVKNSDPQIAPLKINTSNGLPLVNGFNNYGQKNKFIYKQNDLVISNDFNGEFVIQNDSLDDEKTILQSIYSGADTSLTPIQTASTNGRVGLPIYEFNYRIVSGINLTITGGGSTFTLSYDYDVEAGDIIWFKGARSEVLEMTSALVGIFTNPTTATGSSKNWEVIRYEVNGFQTHVALLEDGTEDFRFVDGSDVEIVTTGNKVAKFESPLFWNTLLNTYYPDFILSIQKPFFCSIDVVLTAWEYKLLSSHKPIYIEQFGGIFYLNKVKQFKLNALTRLELLKIKPV